MVSLHRNKNITKTEKRWFQGMPIVEDFGTLDSESEHSRKHLMGHPSWMNKTVELRAVLTMETQFNVSEGNNSSNLSRHHSCDILTKTALVLRICLRLKSFGLISSAEEISTWPNTWLRYLVARNHSYAVLQWKRVSWAKRDANCTVGGERGNQET